MASEQTFGAMIDRKSIVLGGPEEEQREFLQSLVTNDVAKASQDTLVYAALLTPQGKYLSDFFIRRTTEGDYALDVAATQAEALAKRLTMYKLRRPVTLTTEAAPVAAIWGVQAPQHGLSDPRDAALGWRVYENAESALEQAVLGDYDLHRLKKSVPESDTDLISNDTYILEAGFERMNGVDFKKGCYVGQEIVARMKHKTELRKKYVLVSVSEDVSQGEPIKTSANKPAGTIFSSRDGIGLALVRLDRVQGAETLMAGTATIKVI